MRSSYTKAGVNFLPVIHHTDGRRETLIGPPLSTRKAAKRYARMEMYERYQRHLRKQAQKLQEAGRG